MSSIVYGGRDFGEWCSAATTVRSGCAVEPTTAEVPGRAGAALVAGHVAAGSVTVTLMMDPGFDPGADGLSEARRELRSWLCQTSGGELVLPEEPGLTWHDAVVTSCGNWSDDGPAATCEVGFLLTDPVAYGREREETGESFLVGGTWPSWPTLTLVAEEGDSVCATDATGAYVLVEREFAGGEVVVVGCEDETCTVDDEDARVDVALGSDFFSLEPGEAELTFAGCSSHVVAFCERWL